MPQSLSLSASTSSRGPGDFARALFRRNETALLICLLLLIIFFALASPTFLTTRNVTNVLGQASLAMVARMGSRSRSPSASAMDPPITIRCGLNVLT